MASSDLYLASSPNYENFEHLLSPGWVPGRKIDASDSQYSTFRENIPYLSVLLVVHPLLRRLYNFVFPIPNGDNTVANGPSVSSKASSQLRLGQRVGYDAVFGLVFLCVLHGFSALKVLIILSLNYLIAKRLPRVYLVPMTWLFNVTVLFANELCQGYPYKVIAIDTFPWTIWDPNSNWGTFFDAHGGLMPRWEILFNITVLRLISFNMDYYWGSSKEVGQNTLLEVSPRVYPTKVFC